MEEPKFQSDSCSSEYTESGTTRSPERRPPATAKRDSTRKASEFVESVRTSTEPIKSPKRQLEEVETQDSTETANEMSSQNPHNLEHNDEEEEPNWGDSTENFDAIYAAGANEHSLQNIQREHGSVVRHLLGQVRIGMDLTKVTLPTFVLERRSLLEMYADFFAHPDEFICATSLSDAEQRFIAVLRFYVAAFYPPRRSGVAKKPYNPVLGETFRCRWTLADGVESSSCPKTNGGPFPGSSINQVTFIGEQVSHHPPISAFYAEHPRSRVSLRAHIWTKSSFLGLSIGVSNIGKAILSLHEHGEEYVMTFPDGYGRSILTTPWIELGGKVEIRCVQTGYRAEMVFHTKSLFGGKPHRLTGSVYHSESKRPLRTLEGEWNGIIHSKAPGNNWEIFVDVRQKPDTIKECEPVASQKPRESRRLWRHVTAALYHNRVETATAAKRWIEDRQRLEEKQRLAEGQSHQPQYFRRLDSLDNKQTEGWEFVGNLQRRQSL